MSDQLVLSAETRDRGGKGASRELRREGRVPVSYTHLRAHETVLDIVCRLMLEKKNTHTNDIHLSTPS